MKFTAVFVSVIVFFYNFATVKQNRCMMNEEISNIENTNRAPRTLRPELQKPQEEPEKQHVEKQQAEVLSAAAVQCPFCGATNDAEAMFCAACGKPLHMALCPHCQSEIDPEADYCETCHRYIRQDVCSFCGAHLGGGEAFCPECGSPRGGIVCPVCHTLNNFAFCKQCGTPLTHEAKLLVKEMQQNPDYKELLDIVSEYATLDDMIPYNSERDVVKDNQNRQLRERVLTLLAKDKGVAEPVIPVVATERMSKEELNKRKAEKIKTICDILEKLAQPTFHTPVQARNYAMACKPAGMRLAWVCNFKHAMHSSPCGCAKPQMGGKWVVLSKNAITELKDDK